MPPRLKSAFASLAIVVFLAVYVGIASTLADRLPDVTWVKLAYFAVVGTFWGIPILPLISWANRPQSRRDRS